MNPSPFEWRNGQPSIFCGMQKDANIAKKASANLSAKLGTRPDPVNLPKKPRRVVNRDGSGRTRPLVHRVDFNAVRAYRLTGKTWIEVAVHFGTSQRAILEHSIRLFPELKRIRHGLPPGRPPVPMPLDEIILSMVAGESLRGAAKRHGVAHSTLRARLVQSPEGLAAIALAKGRSDAMNAKNKREAQDKRNRCGSYFEAPKNEV